MCVCVCWGGGYIIMYTNGRVLAQRKEDGIVKSMTTSQANSIHINKGIVNEL